MRLPGGSRGALLVIPLAALVAILPLIIYGCSCGHDFDFHLLNWMEAVRQFGQRNLHPHWAYTPAFNAGEPRFVFYPPLSWVLGALLGMLLTHLPRVSETTGWSATPILFTWIALTASGFTLYRLARTFAGTSAALLAAVLYLANPYMLFTAYERTAYAELLAAAWIPLLLHGILRERVTFSGIALPVALLWLTNAPAAVMGSYALALLTMIQVATSPGGTDLAAESWILRHRSALQLACKTAAGIALGLGLAAFYIVPAAYERRFVQISMATIAGMRIDQNFLFNHTGNSPDALLHDTVLHTASLIAVILLAATAVALVAVQRTTKRGEARHGASFPVLPLAIVTAGIALLLTPLSGPVWKYAPEAAFLQFPWRLLAILAPIFALALAAALTGLRPVERMRLATLAIGTTALAAVLSFPAYHLFHQPCDPEDTAPARLTLFDSNAGTDPTDEYTPTSADNDVLKPGDPPYWLAKSPNATAPAAVQSGPAPMHLSVTAPVSEFLILDLRDYPAWRITRNGTPVLAPEQRDDGLMVIPLSAGLSTVDIRYARMPDETAGDAVTLIALAILLLLWISYRLRLRQEILRS